MSILLILILVYVLHRHLSDYRVVNKLRNMCNFDWLDSLLFVVQNFINKNKKIPPLVSCFLFVIGFAVIVLLLQAIFLYASKGVGLLLFNIVILLYCLFSASKKRYSSIFVAAFEHNFAIIFWFVLLGTMGAALYWLFMVGGEQIDTGEPHGKAHYAPMRINIMKQLSNVRRISDFLFVLHAIAAWIPARLTGLVFSLIGDFEKAFHCWKGIMYNFNLLHSEVLNRCGEAAVGELTTKKIHNLVDRAFVVWFVIYVSLIIF